MLFGLVQNYELFYSYLVSFYDLLVMIDQDNLIKQGIICPPFISIQDSQIKRTHTHYQNCMQI